MSQPLVNPYLACMQQQQKAPVENPYLACLATATEDIDERPRRFRRLDHGGQKKSVAFEQQPTVIPIEARLQPVSRYRFFEEKRKHTAFTNDDAQGIFLRNKSVLFLSLVMFEMLTEERKRKVPQQSPMRKRVKEAVEKTSAMKQAARLVAAAKAKRCTTTTTFYIHQTTLV